MKAGAALPMVLLALGLVAALTVGGSFVTRRFVADNRLSQSASDLEPALEAALIGAVEHMDPGLLDTLSQGGTAACGASAVTRLVTGCWVTKASNRVYALVSEASDDHKPLQIKRLMLVVMRDSTGLRPIPRGGWTRLP